MSIATIPTAVLRKVLSIREQIESLEAELGKIAGAPLSAPVSSSALPEKATRKKGKMSAAGRARIVAAQKARWAKVRGETTTTPVTPTPVKKRSKLSAAGRARIAAAQKARWAKVKVAKK